jgi:hypothetical protein
MRPSAGDLRRSQIARGCPQVNDSSADPRSREDPARTSSCLHPSALNQAVKRNPSRFPGDFAFQLEPAEFKALRSQAATSGSEHTEYAKENANRSQIVTSSPKHRGTSLGAWAFTEHGALMAANILRSERAVQMSVFVVRAFVRLREHAVANTAVLKRLAEIDRTLLRHDAALRDVYQKLLPLLQPLADPPKRRIGFHTDD